MINFHQRHLVVALSAALGFLTLAPLTAVAQQQSASPSMREQRAKRMAELGKSKEQDTKNKDVAQPALYPNATRISPEAKASPKMIKNLEALQTLYEKQDMPGVIAKAEEIVTMPAANAYEKSYAYSIAANAVRIRTTRPRQPTISARRLMPMEWKTMGTSRPCSTWR